jgi:hypothetical protein
MSQVNENEPKQPLEEPDVGPKGPRTPYPVGDPVNPKGPGSEPDYFPGNPGGPQPSLRQVARRDDYPRIRITWQQAH